MPQRPRHRSSADRTGELALEPRALLAWLATLALGAFSGPVLGEYEFRGAFPPVAGVLTGLLLGEVSVAIARCRSVANGAITVVGAAGGLLLAGWLSSSRGLDPYPAGAWLAAGLGAAAGWLRAGSLRLATGRRQRGGDSDGGASASL